MHGRRRGVEKWCTARDGEKKKVIDELSLLKQTPSCFYHWAHFGFARRINPICISWQPRGRHWRQPHSRAQIQFQPAPSWWQTSLFGLNSVSFFHSWTVFISCLPTFSFLPSPRRAVSDTSKIYPCGPGLCRVQYNKRLEGLWILLAHG